MKFSSPERYVPHGVLLDAQLFSVPMTRVPLASALVFIIACPAAGPRTSNTALSIAKRRA
jgi:hypothetical protein